MPGRAGPHPPIKVAPESLPRLTEPPDCSERGAPGSSSQSRSAAAMNKILDVGALYENLLNLSLSEEEQEGPGSALSRRRSASSSDTTYSSGELSGVWPVPNPWSTGAGTAEQLRPVGEPNQRSLLRPDRSVSLIEGKALPPPPPGFPPLKAGPAAAPALSSRYKTELCRTFSETGRCKYGAKCQFAHGAAELRTVSRHPKYKTELCHKFYLYGQCPYGSRCHFIHYPEEAQPRGSSASSPQLLRQSVSYSGVSAARRSSPLPSIPDPASFSRASSVSPPPSSTDLLSPTFGHLSSDPISRISTLGESLSMPPVGGCCSCRCGVKGAPLSSPFQSHRDLFAAAPGTPTSTVASILPRTPSTNSLSDPDCYSSSSSLSGSESPVFDLLQPSSGPVGSAHRLPIFNRLSVSE